MTDAPLVSVLVANFNGMAVIDDCLQSVVGQEGGLVVEIIVHDDASTDGSAAYIREKYPAVALIESEQNVGFCVANNRMAAVAKGQYLLLLNNDAALFPDALETLHAEAVRLGRPAILGLPQYDAETGELLDIGSLLDPFLNPVPNLDPSRREVGMVMGSCLWIPNGLWDSLGGFPEWFESIGEDLYLCFRARLSGHPVKALPVSGYHHHVGRSFGGGKAAAGRLATTFRRRALSERNKTFVLATTIPFPYAQLLLPLHLLLLLLEGALLSLLKLDGRYLGEVYLPVFVALWQRRRELREKRRVAMVNRSVANADFLTVIDLLPYKLHMFIRHGLPDVK